MEDRQREKKRSRESEKSRKNPVKPRRKSAVDSRQDRRGSKGKKETADSVKRESRGKEEKPDGARRTSAETDNTQQKTVKHIIRRRPAVDQRSFGRERKREREGKDGDGGIDGQRSRRNSKDVEPSRKTSAEPENKNKTSLRRRPATKSKEETKSIDNGHKIEAKKRKSNETAHERLAISHKEKQRASKEFTAEGSAEPIVSAMRTGSKEPVAERKLSAEPVSTPQKAGSKEPVTEKKMSAEPVSTPQKTAEKEIKAITVTTEGNKETTTDPGVERKMSAEPVKIEKMDQKEVDPQLNEKTATEKSEREAKNEVQEPKKIPLSPITGITEFLAAELKRTGSNVVVTTPRQQESPASINIPLFGTPKKKNSGVPGQSAEASEEKTGVDTPHPFANANRGGRVGKPGRYLAIENLYDQMGPWNPLHMRIIILNSLIFAICYQIRYYVDTSYRKNFESGEQKYTTLIDLLRTRLADDHFFTVDVERILMLNAPFLLILTIFYFESRRQMILFGLSSIFFGSLIVSLRNALMQKIGLFFLNSGELLVLNISLLSTVESLPLSMRNTAFVMALLGQAAGALLIKIFLIAITDYHTFPIIISITGITALTLFLYRTIGKESIHYLVLSKQTREIKKLLRNAEELGGLPVFIDVDQLIDDVIYRDESPISKWDTFVLVIHSGKFLKQVVTAAGLVLISSTIDSPELSFLRSIPLARAHLLPTFRSMFFALSAIPAGLIVVKYGRQVFLRFSFLLVFATHASVFILPTACVADIDGDELKIFKGFALWFQHAAAFMFSFVPCARLLVWMQFSESLPCDVRHIAIFAFESVDNVIDILTNRIGFDAKDHIFPNKGCAMNTALGILGFIIASFYKDIDVMPVVVTDIIPSENDQPSEDPEDSPPLFLSGEKMSLEPLFSV